VAQPVVLTAVSASGTEAREALRRTNDVRLVEPSEEGTAVDQLPDGVYGFTYSPALAAPLFRTFRYRTFEMHRVNGESFVVGFLNPDDAEQLQAARDAVEITLEHDATGEAVMIVGVPYSRIVHHRRFSVLNTPALTMQVKP
jgi:hypothetical protein